MEKVRKMAKYPVEVELIGQDGNAFAIIGAVMREMKRAGFLEEATEYMNAAQACGSYDELLQLTMNTVEVF